MENLAAYIEAARGKDVDVLVGSDGKISAAHALGASGAIAGTANLITNVVVSLWRALELAGVPVGPARRPVAETTPEVDEKVRAMLDHYGIAHE